MHKAVSNHGGDNKLEPCRMKFQLSGFNGDQKKMLSNIISKLGAIYINDSVSCGLLMGSLHLFDQ